MRAFDEKEGVILGDFSTRKFRWLVDPEKVTPEVRKIVEAVSRAYDKRFGESVRNS